MSTDVGTAVVQHALDVGRLYLQNSVLTRGIPDQPHRLQVHPPEPEPAPVVLPTPAAPTPQPVAATPPQPVAPAASPLVVAPVTVARPASNIAQWAALAIAAVAGGSSIAIPWVVNAIYGVRPTPTPVVVQPAGNTSLLQYLEDTGYHLPREKRPR